jgi:hypothetical protein
MRSFAIFAILLLSISTAHAQTKTVIAGKPFRLDFAYSTNPDCTTTGDVVIRVTSPPSNDSVSISKRSVFPNFPASNIRSACNSRRVPGTIATYIARRGYTGPDTVSLESIFPSGLPRQQTYYLTVR